MLNPLHCVCLEQDCLKTNPVVRLKRLNNISSYVNHLEQHLNLRGDSSRFSKLMMDRLSANVDIFSDKDQIQAISIAPRTVLNEYGDNLFTPNFVAAIKRLMIKRDVGRGPKYLTKWLDMIIQSSVLKASNVLYQSLDAFIATALHYPHPMSDWSAYKNLFLLSTALYSVTTESVYKCFRGNICCLRKYLKNL